MSKILGLDLGTNSIGWAIIEEGNDEKLIDKGCIIFPEGVKEEQGKEISRAAERTSFRLARRQKFRRKLRKYNTLKVLIEYNMCPLSMDELEKWRKEKEYPKNKDFLEWLKTDEKNGISPYYYRAMAVEKKLAPTEVGRALYHITQRRGYKSNRLESTDENQKGVVNTSINEITNSKGDKTLGQYFYDLYKKGEKIRKKYTSREQHYLEEFKKICEVQGFSEELTKKLEKAIFFQRPLKSQKGLVGRCVFEKSKPRAPISHPLFEEFRMLQFINSIKYKDNNGKFVFLNENQRERIKPLFYRKSKSSFDFKDIKEKLFGNENVEFNYKNEKDVSGCPTIANFIDLFGENWKNICIKYTREKDNKESTINYETIWNVLFSFNSDEKLIEFAKKRLGFDDEKAKKFSKINLKQGYASLSLCAIRKILPFLEQGLLYTYAVYLANLDKVLKKAEKKQYKESIKKDIEEIIKTYIAAKKIEYVINSYIDKYRTNHYNLNAEKEDFKKKIENELGNDYEALDNNEKNELIDKYYNILEKQVRKNEYVKIKRLDEKINELLKTKYDIPDQALEKIYHPSDIDIYPEAKISKDGKKYLGSPRTSSIRNPMAMRTLHQLRYFINTLIKEDKISYDDQINIEVARELNDANKRAAIRRYQNELEKKRKEYAQKIRDTLHIEPTDTDILKYQLWEEQNHICIYTGREISLKDFLSDNPTYDIEHTIPRSISIDDSQENLTLCENDFNRNIKMNQIPQQLGNINEILQRINHWKEEYERLEKEIEKAKKRSKNARTKEEKDEAIQTRHYLTLKKDYLKNKYNKFLIKQEDIDKIGFTNRQLRDTAIITKYALAYLKTLFNNVNSIKGTITAQFRKIWGLENEYEKKARTKHSHHTIDAIVLACITKPKYDRLAQYYQEKERELMPKFRKPWQTFVEDIKKIEDEVIVKHIYNDNALKQTKKKLRVRGKIKYIIDNNGNKKPIYLKGKGFRGSLHLDTYYGAIKRKDENGVERLYYVVRKPLDYFKNNEKKLDDIVDEVVKEKIKKAIEEGRRTGKQLNEILSGPIWMNEEKKIPIKKVRIYSYFENCKKLKEHAFLSNKEYKNYIYVQTGGNALMGIYEDQENRDNRDFIIYKNLELAKMKQISLPDTYNNLKLKYKLKQGLSVILYKDNPNEIFKLKDNEIILYLYTITGLFVDEGRIELKNNIEARKNTEIKNYLKERREPYPKKGEFVNDGKYYPVRNLMFKQFNALVEGVDFIITMDSKIEFLKK